MSTLVDMAYLHLFTIGRSKLLDVTAQDLLRACISQSWTNRHDVGSWLALCDLLEERGVESSLRSEVVKVFNLGK